MKLDITSLGRAIDRLREGMETYEADSSIALIRDGYIQRFEFTYELSHKMLKRYLELTSASPSEVDAMSFQEQVRLGNEQTLLLNDWSKWRDYRKMRGQTSHAYDEEIALEVVAGIPAFLDEAAYLYDQLAKRIA
jgi:nucleotidyltransferase substrate binding protein, HI0074 family